MVQRLAASLGAALFVLTVFTSPAFAQSAITGVVKDASGAVLPGVTVEAASDVLIEKVKTVMSDGQGVVPDRRSAARHLHRDVLAPGLPDLQARRHRAAAEFTATINADMKVGALPRRSR